MKTTVTEARWAIDRDGAWVSFLAPSPAEARAMCESLKPDKPYTVEVKRHYERRSLDANALAWKLLGDLSVVTRVPPIEMYRNYIRDVGGNYEIIPVRADRIENWKRIWCSGHYGREVEDLGDCKKIPGYHYIASYIGSSDYDKAQMSRLLDLIITDCKEFGVEIISERERSILVEEWGGK